MIRQTDIPHVQPGEPLSAALLNQLREGANTGRRMTGDGTIDVTSIGGSVGFTDPRPPVHGDKGVMVLVQPIAVRTKLSATGQTNVTINGMYEGTLFLQPAIYPEFQEFPTSASVKTPVPFPNNITDCYVINEAEMNARTNLVAENAVVTMGRIIGAFLGLPLVWVRIDAGASTTLFNPNGSMTLNGASQLRGGVYSGRTFGPITGSLTLTGSTFSSSTIGTDPGSNNGYFVNLPEMGKTTYDLLSTANTATLAIGINIGVATDGYPVFAGTLVYPGCS